MPRKYFVWSFDDGVVQDRRIVAVLREFGLAATFHLNSGLFGAKTFIGHPPTVPHERLEAAEARELYEGFEIAAHTCTHRDLSVCNAAERRREITDDVAALSGYTFLLGCPSTAPLPYSDRERLRESVRAPFGAPVYSEHRFGQQNTELLIYSRNAPPDELYWSF